MGPCSFPLNSYCASRLWEKCSRHNVSGPYLYRAWKLVKRGWLAKQKDATKNTREYTDENWVAKSKASPPRNSDFNAILAVMGGWLVAQSIGLPCIFLVLRAKWRQMACWPDSGALGDGAARWGSWQLKRPWHTRWAVWWGWGWDLTWIFFIEWSSRDSTQFRVTECVSGELVVQGMAWGDLTWVFLETRKWIAWASMCSIYSYCLWSMYNVTLALKHPCRMCLQWVSSLNNINLLKNDSNENPRKS